MNTHNMCFYGEIRKIIHELLPNTSPVRPLSAKSSNFGVFQLQPMYSYPPLYKSIYLVGTHLICLSWLRQSK